jgi:enamine deaminase RidA (YjgF/YER057c/UK114 family)
MTKDYLNPASLFPSQQYGFSQVVVAPAGRLVFIAGQVAWDAQENLVGSGDLRAQVWQALRNVDTAVQAAGGTLADVVSLRIYVAAPDPVDLSAIREGLLAFFPADWLPTTTWIGVRRLANEGFLIEIEPIAVIE